MHLNFLYTTYFLELELKEWMFLLFVQHLLFYENSNKKANHTVPEHFKSVVPFNSWLKHHLCKGPTSGLKIWKSHLHCHKAMGHKRPCMANEEPPHQGVIKLSAVPCTQHIHSLIIEFCTHYFCVYFFWCFEICFGWSPFYFIVWCFWKTRTVYAVYVPIQLLIVRQLDSHTSCLLSTSTKKLIKWP